MQFQQLATILILLVTFGLQVKATSIEVGDENFYSLSETLNITNPVMRCDEKLHLCFIYSPQKLSLKVYDLLRLKIIQNIPIQEDQVKEIHLVKQVDHIFIILQCQDNQMLIYVLDNTMQGMFPFQSEKNRINPHSSPNYPHTQPFQSGNKNIPEMNHRSNLRRENRSGRLLQESPNQLFTLLISSERKKCSKQLQFSIIRLDINKFYQQGQEQNPKATNIHEIEIDQFPLQLKDSNRKIIQASLSVNQHLLTCVDDDQEIGFLVLDILVNPYIQNENPVNKLPEIQTINYNTQFHVKKLDTSFSLQRIMHIQEEFENVILVYQSQKRNIIVLDTLLYSSTKQIIINVRRQIINNFHQELIVSHISASLMQRKHHSQVQQLNAIKETNEIENIHQNSDFDEDGQDFALSQIHHIQLSKMNPNQIGGFLIVNETGIKIFYKKCSNKDEIFFFSHMDCNKDIYCVKSREKNYQQICFTEKNHNSGYLQHESMNSNKSLKFIKRITMRYQTSLDLEQFFEQNKVKIAIACILLVGLGCIFQERIQNCFQRNKKSQNNEIEDEKDSQLINNRKQHYRPNEEDPQANPIKFNNLEIEMSKVQNDIKGVDKYFLNQNNIENNSNDKYNGLANNVDYVLGFENEKHLEENYLNLTQSRSQTHYGQGKNRQEEDEELEEEKQNNQENSKDQMTSEYLSEYNIDKFCYSQKKTQILNINQNQIFGFETDNRDNQVYLDHGMFKNCNQKYQQSNYDYLINQELLPPKITDSNEGRVNQMLNNTQQLPELNLEERQQDAKNHCAFLNNVVQGNQFVKNQQFQENEQYSRNFGLRKQVISNDKLINQQRKQLQYKVYKSNQLSATDHQRNPLNQQLIEINKIQNQKDQILEGVDQNNLKQIYFQFDEKEFIIPQKDLNANNIQILKQIEKIENEGHIINASQQNNCNLNQEILSSSQDFIRYLQLEQNACQLQDRSQFEYSQIFPSPKRDQLQQFLYKLDDSIYFQEKKEEQPIQLEQIYSEKDQQAKEIVEENQELDFNHNKSTISSPYYLEQSGVSCNKKRTIKQLLSKRTIRYQQIFKYQRDQNSIRKGKNNFITQLYSSHQKSIQLKEEKQSQFRKVLNCFTQISCFNYPYKSLMQQKKFKSQNYQIPFSGPNYQIQKSNQQSKCTPHLKPEAIESYNQLILHKKNNQQYNLQKSEFVYNCENHQNSLTLSTLSNKLEPSNANQQQQFINNQVKSTINNCEFYNQKNKISNFPSTTHNNYTNNSMWPLTFQEQSTNFEEEILNQMDLSGSTNSQSNSSLLNSDFQCQRFMDNFQEQMGPNSNPENINKYDNFFCVSDPNEKSFLSTSSNELGDTVKKIRHINNDFQQQEIFDIKDFQFISENLFEESLELKKQKDINNILMSSSLSSSNIFDGKNQMEKLQKMTEQINNDFLLSCANLLNITKNI